ncbi:MAG: hypothetical protein J07HX5_00808 [halophilic archaeon J07HX5]|nr:MAG: hypothetical protein J07HX5_00808 [halophilic archaeon J07HX5]
MSTTRAATALAHSFVVTDERSCWGATGAQRRRLEYVMLGHFGAACGSSARGDLSMSGFGPITDTHPGLLEITLEGGSGKDGVGHRRDLPFGCYVGRSRNGSRLLLLPAETYAPAYVSA